MAFVSSGYIRSPHCSQECPTWVFRLLLHTVPRSSRFSGRKLAVLWRLPVSAEDSAVSSVPLRQLRRRGLRDAPPPAGVCSRRSAYFPKGFLFGVLTPLVAFAASTNSFCISSSFKIILGGSAGLPSDLSPTWKHSLLLYAFKTHPYYCVRLLLIHFCWKINISEAACPCTRWMWGHSHCWQLHCCW